jgi:mitogen-activated protein kinase 1/3
LPDTEKKDPTADLRDKYPNHKALDLINKCLEFDPKNRLTSAQCLAHPYFEGLHDPEDEPEFKGTIDNAFEYDNKLSVMDVRMMILKEINKVNKENEED